MVLNFCIQTVNFFFSKLLQGRFLHINKLTLTIIIIKRYTTTTVTLLYCDLASTLYITVNLIHIV